MQLQRILTGSCDYRLVVDRKRRVQCEARLGKPDGGYLWVELTITDLLDDPAVLAIVNNYRDITGRKRRQLAEAELALLCDFASVSVFSVDLAGSIQSWHPGCERMLGYTASEMAGVHVRSLIPGNLEASDRDSRSAVVETGCASRVIATHFLTRGGAPVCVEVTLSPLIQTNAVQGVAYFLRIAGPGPGTRRVPRCTAGLAYTEKEPYANKRKTCDRPC